MVALKNVNLMDLFISMLFSMSHARLARVVLCIQEPRYHKSSTSLSTSGLVIFIILHSSFILRVMTLVL